MRKRSFVLLALAMLVSLSACADTPEQSVVAQKNTERLIQAASAEPEEGTTLSETAQSAPEHYTWFYENSDGTIKITADADVTLPAGDSIPMYRVSAGALSQETVDALYHSFFPDGDTWVIENSVATKADLEEEIVAFRQLISDCENGVDTEGLSDEEIVRLIAEYQACLDDLEQRYETAPEVSGAQKVPTDATLRERGYEDGGEAIYEALCMNDIGTFDAASAPADASWGSGIHYEREDAARYSAQTGLPADQEEAETAGTQFGLSFADAKAAADGLLTAAGVETKLESIYLLYDGETDADSPTFGGFELHYVRAIDGIPLADTSYASLGGEEYAIGWPDEEMVVSVDRDGIVKLDWKSPLTVGETVSDNVGLLSFRDAADIFEQMVPLIREGSAYADPVEQIDLQELTVDRAELRFVRIRDSGGARTGLLTPAWVFYGEEINHVNYYDETEGAWKDWGTTRPRQELVLVVNAVDGSIIDY